ncbi:MAG: hypothetical protein IJY93_04215 [Clostridia bacterium]|nr:hypothetical protein [Clostridia bacterium]
MNVHKSVPAPETIQSGVYEKVNTILEKERTDELTEGISDSTKRECDSAYDRYKNDAAMNDADNELADSGNGYADSTNDSDAFTDENAYLKDKRESLTPSDEAEIQRAAEEARRRDRQKGMVELTQRGIGLAEIAGFIADRITISTGKTRESVRLEGKDGFGNYYQLELSIIASSVLADPLAGI